MFSAEQYRALRAGAGLLVRQDRGLLTVRGADRLTFLQGLLTNDAAALGAGRGCYAAMLTPNGRMTADMRVLELGDSTLLEVDAGHAAALRERLDQMIFSEDAQVEDESATRRQLGVYGPQAAAAVARALDQAVGAPALEAMGMHDSLRVEGASGPVVVVRSDEVGADGFDLFVDAAAAGALADRVRAAGAIDVQPETAEVTRIEAGRPRFPQDMNEDTIPLEAGIEDRAISLTKGCYVGQEIIIRVLHRGHGRVAKRLVGLSLDPGAALPGTGDAIRAGERQIGHVTSAAFSPALGRPIALGYVHRDFAEAAAAVTIGGAGTPQAATVTALPFTGREAASAR